MENDAIQAQMIISKVKTGDGAGDADGKLKTVDVNVGGEFESLLLFTSCSNTHS